MFSIYHNNNQELIVVENENAQIIGTLQLSFIQYLTYRGGIRAQIEAVRIRKDQRGVGLGKKMFDWAINRAKEKKGTRNNKRKLCDCNSDNSFICSNDNHNVSSPQISSVGMILLYTYFSDYSNFSY